MFNVTKIPWKYHVNSFDRSNSNQKQEKLDARKNNKSSDKNTKSKKTSKDDNEKIKMNKKKRIGGKKKRRRKPLLKNSPITYIKLPAAPYSFERTDGSSSSFYSPKSSSSSYFETNPLQALFKGVFGEADKSGKINKLCKINKKHNFLKYKYECF